jgi:hypothetical protein
MKIHERVLNLSAFGIVDDIIFDPPFVVSPVMINQLGINEGKSVK